MNNNPLDELAAATNKPKPIIRTTVVTRLVGFGWWTLLMGIAMGLVWGFIIALAMNEYGRLPHLTFLK